MSEKCKELVFELLRQIALLKGKIILLEDSISEYEEFIKEKNLEEEYVAYIIRKYMPKE